MFQGAIATTCFAYRAAADKHLACGEKFGRRFSISDKTPRLAVLALKIDRQSVLFRQHPSQPATTLFVAASPAMHAGFAM